MSGYPCSAPGCENAASWAILSEQPRVGGDEVWSLWNYVGTMICDGHRDSAEDEALQAEKHYRLIAVPS
jgi:hypothetical protein